MIVFLCLFKVLILGFTFKSVIPWVNICVWKSQLICFLCMSVLLHNQYLLKSWFFLYSVASLPLSKTSCPIDVWLYFMLSILFHWSTSLSWCQHHTVLVPGLEVRQCQFSSLTLFEVVFGSSRYSAYPCKVWHQVISLCKNVSLEFWDSVDSTEKFRKNSCIDNMELLNSWTVHLPV